MFKVRNANKIELDTEIEVVDYSTIERYRKMIETKNLKKYGKSVSFSSMDFPNGIVVETFLENNKVKIHSSWKKILWDAYFLNINPVLVKG